MSLYYQDEHVTLYHGDCLEITDWLAADVLVTDPPYGIGWAFHAGGTRKARGYRHGGIINDLDCSARDRALRAWGWDRPGFVFGSLRAPKPEGVFQTLIWRKPGDTGVIGSTTGYRTDIEAVYMLGRHMKRPAQRSSVLESRCGTKNNYQNGHPHAKPTAILEQLIEWTEGTVADPFAGSGSTLIAARNLGRKAIGVEIEERYCELVATRLAQMCLPI